MERQLIADYFATIDDAARRRSNDGNVGARRRDRVDPGTHPRLRPRQGSAPARRPRRARRNCWRSGRSRPRLPQRRNARTPQAALRDWAAFVCFAQRCLLLRRVDRRQPIRLAFDALQVRIPQPVVVRQLDRADTRRTPSPAASIGFLSVFAALIASSSTSPLNTRLPLTAIAVMPGPMPALNAGLSQRTSQIAPSPPTMRPSEYRKSAPPPPYSACAAFAYAFGLSLKTRLPAAGFDAAGERLAAVEAIAQERGPVVGHQRVQRGDHVVERVRVDLPVAVVHAEELAREVVQRNLVVRSSTQAARPLRARSSGRRSSSPR